MGKRADRPDVTVGDVRVQSALLPTGGAVMLVAADPATGAILDGLVIESVYPDSEDGKSVLKIELRKKK